MATLEILEYGIVFAIALIFSLVSIQFKKEEVYFKFIAGLCWFIFAIVHFVVGTKTDVLTYALSFLWMGLGLLFIIMGIQEFFSMKKDRIWGFSE